MNTAIIIPRGAEIPDAPEDLKLSSGSEGDEQPEEIDLVLEGIQLQVEAMFEDLENEVKRLHVGGISEEADKFKQRLLGVLGEIQNSVNDSRVNWEVSGDNIEINAKVARENLEALSKLDTLMRIVERASTAKSTTNSEIGSCEDKLTALGIQIDDALGEKRYDELVDTERQKIDGFKKTITKKEGQKDKKEARLEALSDRVKSFLTSEGVDIDSLFAEAEDLAEYLGDNQYLTNNTELQQLLRMVAPEEFAHNFKVASRIVEERKKERPKSKTHLSNLTFAIALLLFAGAGIGLFVNREKEESESNKPVPRRRVSDNGGVKINLIKVPENGSDEEIKGKMMYNCASAVKGFLVGSEKPSLSRKALEGEMDMLVIGNKVKGQEATASIRIVGYKEVKSRVGLGSSHSTRIAKIRVTFGGALSGEKEATIKVVNAL